jgi:hypothetical protein
MGAAQSPHSLQTMFRVLRGREHRLLFKGDKPVLRLPLLVWEFSLGGGEEAMVIVRRWFRLMEIIVRCCPEKERTGYFFSEF